MSLREELELYEKENLSPYAKLSVDSVGRDRKDELCDIRTIFQQDRDRILHCKSFRRLKHKTQVYLSPQGDHYRTRLTHTLEVSQIARTIGKALRLNDELVEAIALGHDLGHTPFGHAGERMLNALCPQGFSHNKQSVRVVEYLEKDGLGLNVSWEVRDGILNHKTSLMPSTLEGKVVRLADKIAYIHHDIDDSIRAMLMTEEEVPDEYRSVLGPTSKDRLDTLVHDIINQSYNKPDILMSEDIEQAMRGLRAFMFENVYTNPIAKGEEGKAEELLERLFYFYSNNPEEMPEFYMNEIKRTSMVDRVVCDYIAGMTDQFAMDRFREYFLPKSWQVY